MENRLHRARQAAQKAGGGVVGRAHHHRVHEATLQHTERPLEQVHDRVVQALVGIDAPIVVEAHHHRGARGLRLFPHHAQRFNVARMKQVEAPIHVEDTGGEQLRHRGRGLHHRFESGPAHILGVAGRVPEHRRARVQAGGVRGVVAEPQQCGRVGKERVGGPRALHRWVVVGLAHQEHAAHEVGGGDVRRAFDHHKQAQVLDALVAVLAVGVGGDVVAVDHILAAVLAHEVRVGHVGRVGHRVRGPLARFDVGHALVKPHDHRALVVEDLLVGVDSDIELVAQLAGLEHGTGVAWG